VRVAVLAAATTFTNGARTRSTSIPADQAILQERLK